MINRLTIALIVILTVAHAVDYCKIQSCQDEPHTVCTYKSPEPSKSCTGLISSGLTDSEKKKVLDTHNQLRQKVASGNETLGNPGPQPPTENMPNLEWDDELEKIAQIWASQCDWGHDKCRDSERFRVGQNVALMGTTGSIDDIKVESMVDDWYSEVKDFNKTYVNQFRPIISPSIGHYTQLVWASTTKLGCGATKYEEQGFNRFYLVCNYGPAGNVIGKPVYVT